MEVSRAESKDDRDGLGEIDVEGMEVQSIEVERVRGVFGGLRRYPEVSRDTITGDREMAIDITRAAQELRRRTNKLRFEGETVWFGKY